MQCVQDRWTAARVRLESHHQTMSVREQPGVRGRFWCVGHAAILTLVRHVPDIPSDFRRLRSKREGVASDRCSLPRCSANRCRRTIGMRIRWSVSTRTCALRPSPSAPMTRATFAEPYAAAASTNDPASSSGVSEKVVKPAERGVSSSCGQSGARVHGRVSTAPIDTRTDRR